MVIQSCTNATTARKRGGEGPGVNIGAGKAIIDIKLS